MGRCCSIRSYEIRYFDTAVDTRHEVSALPILIQNFPNPFNPQTAIRYTLTESDAHVQLCLFNVIGECVRTLVNEVQSAGLHLVYWNGTDKQGLLLENGIYEIRIVVKGHRRQFHQSRKMIMMR
jgi:hypothetical protein